MKIFSLAAGLMGAATLAQFPEVSQQYIQRLSGAVDELAIVVADFDRSAASAGLSRDEALAELTGSTFLDARNSDMTRAIYRYETLSADLTLLQSAGPFERLILMPARLDTDIGARAIEDFAPAVPVTGAGLGFAGIGFLGGYGLWAILAGLFGRGLNSARSKKAV